MHDSQPAWSALLLSLIVLATVAVLTWAPAFASFGLAIAAAISWCIWIERHPLA